MASTASQLREMAAECRQLADTAKTEIVRLELMEVAERFDRVAQYRQLREGRRHLQERLAGGRLSNCDSARIVN